MDIKKTIVKKSVTVALFISQCKMTKKEIAKLALVSEKTVERQMKNMPNIKYVGRGYSGH